MEKARKSSRLLATMFALVTAMLLGLAALNAPAFAAGTSVTVYGVPEPYAYMEQVRQRISIDGNSGPAYCVEQGKDQPPVGGLAYNQISASQYTPAHPYLTGTQLEDALARVLYAGYGSDALGLNSTAQLDDDNFHKATALAVQYFTDYSHRLGDGREFGKILMSDSPNTLYFWASAEGIEMARKLIAVGLDTSIQVSSSWTIYYFTPTVSKYQTVITGGEDPVTPTPDPEPTIEPARGQISITKTLDGKEPADKRFSFQLFAADAEGNPTGAPIQTVTNNSNGVATFDELSYNTAGTYNYVVREVNDFQEGIVYDATPDKKVTVTVTSEAAGGSSATTEAADFPASFTNLHPEDWGQNVDVRLNGPIVVDAKGNVVSGAQVTVVRSNGAELYKWRSDNGGVTLRLRSGETYTLKAAKNGYTIANQQFDVNATTNSSGASGIAANWETFAYTNHSGNHLGAKSVSFGNLTENVYCLNRGLNAVAKDFPQRVGRPLSADLLAEQLSWNTSRASQQLGSDIATGYLNDNTVPSGYDAEAALKKIIYNGYPTNANGDNASYESTQRAVFAYAHAGTNEKAAGSTNYLGNDQTAWKLWRYAVSGGGKDVPAGYNLNLYVPKDNTVGQRYGQSFIGAIFWGGSTSSNVQVNAQLVATTSTQATILKAEAGTVEFANTTKPNEPEVPVNENGKVIIEKINPSGEYVSGAGLQILTDPDNKIVKEFTSNGTAQEFELSVGKYILREVSVPAGYQKAADVSFTVTAMNKETVAESVLPKGTVTATGNTDALQWIHADNGSIAAYCLQLSKNNPTTRGVAYNETNASAVNQLDSRRVYPNTDIAAAIARVLYAGYGSNATGIVSGLSDYEAQLATAIAVNYFTDYSSATSGNQQYGAAVDAGRLSSNAKVNQAGKNLVAYGKSNTSVPSSLEVKYYAPQDSSYQLIAAGGTVKQSEVVSGEPAKVRMIDVKEAKIGTTATDSETNDHIAMADDKVTIKDVVSYENLTPGVEYTMTGQLHKKSDGSAVGREESVKFTPESANGSVELTFTIDARELANDSVVAFETCKQGEDTVATHADLTDEGQTVYFPEARTNATDKADGDKTVDPTVVTVVDKVTYSNLVVGKTYTVSGTLHVKNDNGSDGGPLVIDGKEVTASKTFTAAQSNGSIDLEFTFDASALGGKEVVAFEKVTYNGQVVAVHEDITDEAQTVDVREFVNITVTKKWVDGDGTTEVSAPEGASVRFQVKADGKNVAGQVATVLPSHNWTYTFKNLPKYQSDETTLINYTLEEVSFTGEGFQPGEVTKVGDNAYEFVASNVKTYQPEITNTTAKLADNAATVEQPATYELAANDAEGVVLSDTIEFKNLDPSKRYTVRATAYKDGEQVRQKSETVSGKTEGSVTISFDRKVSEGTYDIKAELLLDNQVVAEHNGTLDTISERGVVTRKVPGATEIEVQLKKVLAGTDAPALLDKQFELRLESVTNPADGAQITEGAKWTGTDGALRTPFKIQFTKAGTYEFKITELQNRPAHNGLTDADYADISFSDETIAFTVVVETGAEELIAKIDGNEITDAYNAGTITNTYEKPEEPEIATTATDEVDGDKYLDNTGTVVVKDDVVYQNLKPGKTYTMEGQLVKKSDESVVATASKTFVASESGSGVVTLTFSVDASVLAGDAAVAFETCKDGDDVVATHTDINDEDQTVYVPEIGTTAVDSETNDHIAMADDVVTITDVVEYSGLVAGRNYTMTGQLHKKSDDSVIGGEKSTTFTASETGAGTVTLTFTINASELAGDSVVAFESASEDGIVVATHADINDEDQTVHFPEAKTNATDAADGDHTLAPNEQVTVIDTVSYSNLIPGKEYTVSGTLHDKETGEACTFDGATATVTFVAQQPSGSVELSFTFNASELQGTQLVAFEQVSTNGTVVAVHEDINDVSQTVEVEEPTPEEPETPTVKISKTDAATSEELPGATLIIKNENDIIVAQWVSTTEPHEVQLAPGAYTLTEITAPEGYEVAETIGFVVDENGLVGSDKVVMEDNHTPEEPENPTVKISKTDAATSQELPGAELIIRDANGKVVESWISSEEPHEVQLAPGTYTLTEITVPDGYERAETITFVVNEEGLVDGDKVVMEDAPVEVPEEPTPEEPAIATTATDAADGDKSVVAEPKAQVKDVVKYENLIAGKSYTMSGELVKKSDQSVVATATTTFTADASGAGEVELVFEFDASALAGQSAVAFETCKDGDEVVATHADLSDADQTVEITEPEIKTTATADGKKSIELTDDEVTIATIVDVVEYTNLTPGKSYTMEGKLVKKSDGASMTDVVSKAFTADKSGNGTVELTFTVNADAVAGDSLVAFEKVTFDGKVVAIHEDINDADQTVEVGPKPEQPEVPTVEISKTDAATTEELPGAELIIKNSDDVIVASWISTTEPHKVQLEPGTYTLTEITAPDGYEVAETITFVVDENGLVDGDKVEMEDAPKPEKPTVEISKTDAATTEELPGAQLIIKDEVGKVVESWTSTDEPHKVQLEPGTYTLTEITAPDGYEVAETITFKVDEDGLVEGDKVEMKDAPVEVPEPEIATTASDNADGDKHVVAEPKAQVKDVVVYKNLIAGKTYTMSGELVKKSDQSVVATASTTFTAAEGGEGEVELVFEFDASKLAGQSAVAFETCSDGKEVVATHADLNDEDQTVNITEPTIETSAAAENGAKTVELKADEPTLVTISDVVSYTNLTPGKTYTMEGQLVKKSDGAPITEVVSKAFTADKSGNGTVELSFTINADIVADDAAVAFEKASFNGTVIAKHEDINDDDQTVEVTEKPGTPENPSVEISKTDAATTEELPGATLIIKNEKADIVDSWVSTEETHKTQLEPGTYTLTEITAPDGYEVAETITFVVDENGLVDGDKVEMKDAPKPENPTVEISKTDAVTTKELPGAQLIIKDADNKVVESWTSTDEPHMVQLEAGTYTLTEITAPDGYEVAETITFKVDENGLVDGDKVEMKDAPTPEEPETPTVEISKTDAVTTEELPGAELIIKDEAGKVVESWTSTDEPHMVQLEPGTYTLTEITAPDGYEVAETITFKVDENGLVDGDKVEMKDAPTPEPVIPVIPENPTVEISKTDATTSEELPGAKLIVTKLGTEDVVAQHTSTSEPWKITLEPGEYTLTELTAPQGYLVAESIDFVVDENGLVGSEKVVMQDAPEVPEIPEIPVETTVKVAKTDLGGVEVERAVIMLTDENGLSRVWRSTAEPHEVTLNPGIYRMVEVYAPEGFEQITTTIEFFIDDNGVVQVLTTAVEGGEIEVAPDGTIILKDAPLPENPEVVISKTDATTSAELPGAKLIITNDANEVVESWTSTSTPHKVK
ncbi:MAG: VaFE repeat-containing surface-anchored protein, partial [Atopobiaceae bacterium]|nr:VaFE repeat-containing surface-anchored protein [Atopobiaceae bacterium]